MQQISNEAEWRNFEIERWRDAVRRRRLELRSLDPGVRNAVFEAICQDLRRRADEVGISQGWVNERARREARRRLVIERGNPDIRSLDVQGIRVVEIVGELDIASAGSTYDLVCAAAEGRDGLIVSLEACRYCDSSALAMLIKLYRHVQGRLVIVGNPWVMRIFRTTGVDKLIPIAPTLDAAIALSTAGGAVDPVE